MFPFFFVGCKKFIMGYKVILFCILSIYFSSKHCKIVCGIPKLHRKEHIYGYIAITGFYCHCNSAYYVSRESLIFQTHSINSHPSIRYDFPNTLNQFTSVYSVWLILKHIFTNLMTIRILISSCCFLSCVCILNLLLMAQ